MTGDGELPNQGERAWKIVLGLLMAFAAIGILGLAAVVTLIEDPTDGVQTVKKGGTSVVAGGMCFFRTSSLILLTSMTVVSSVSTALYKQKHDLPSYTYIILPSAGLVTSHASIYTAPPTLKANMMNKVHANHCTQCILVQACCFDVFFRVL